MRLFRVSALCVLAIFLPVGITLYGENLVFNSSFELGTAGYDSRSFQRASSNPKMEYESPVIDTSTFVSGRQSLRIPNSFSEHKILFAREFKAFPDTEYNFSIYMKSSAEDYPVRLRFLSYATSKNRWGDDKKVDVKVSKEWNRFEFSFKTPSLDAGCEYYTFLLESCREPDAVGHDLWLDDLSLSSNKSQTWSAGASLEVAASVERSLYILDDVSSKSAVARIDAVNNSKDDIQAKLTLNVIDDYSGAKGFSHDFALALKPSERKSISCNLPLDRYGACRVELDASAGKASCSTFPGFFAVIGKYESRPIDTDKTFCVGVNTGIGDLQPPYWNMIKKPGFPASGLSQEDYVKLLSVMGCRLVRDWDGDAGLSFDWRRIEPANGSFDFSIPDRTISLAAKYGIEIIPVVGGRIGCKSDGHLPEWLRPDCVKRSVTPYNNRPQTTPEFPPVDAWRKYVHAIGERYKGKLSHYEIVNEPNADYFPKEYLLLLKAAYEELKAVDPNCKIIGFCSSGDYGLPLCAFLSDCAKEGGLSYVDIVSYHPYETPNLASKIPSDAMDASCKGIIGKYANGRDIPLWNTELYYLTGKKQNGADEENQPHDVAQRFLTDLGEGLGQSTSIPANSLWKNVLAPHMNGIFARQWIPSSNYVIQNALARFFEGATPKDKFKWGCDSVCYVYERDGKSIAAFWHYGDVKGVKVKLALTDADVQLYDLYGNKLPLGSGLLSFGPAPLYLEAKKGVDADTFIDLLKRAQVKPD